jgi:hypothetical protein
MRPTSAFSGSRESACASDCRSAASSSSTRQTSTTKRYAGGGALGLCRLYSMVVYVGKSSAGRFVSEMLA